jgi:hypothetical protein
MFCSKMTLPRLGPGRRLAVLLLPSHSVPLKEGVFSHISCVEFIPSLLSLLLPPSFQSLRREK